MITVNGWCACGMEESRGMGRWVFSQWRRWGKTLAQIFSNLSLKTLKELERRKPGTYSSISQPSQKMTTLSFAGGSRLGLPCRGALFNRFEREDEKNKFGSISKRPVNILKAVIVSERSRRSSFWDIETRQLEQVSTPKTNWLQSYPI